MIGSMIYGFRYSCLFSRSVCAFFLTETSVGGKNPENRKNAVKTAQLVHKFNEKFKNVVLPLKPEQR